MNTYLVWEVSSHFQSSSKSGSSSSSSLQLDFPSKVICKMKCSSLTVVAAVVCYLLLLLSSSAKWMYEKYLHSKAKVNIVSDTFKILSVLLNQKHHIHIYVNRWTLSFLTPKQNRIESEIYFSASKSFKCKMQGVVIFASSNCVNG